jgi:tetratricopeptide (TPR) repeat protein
MEEAVVAHRAALEEMTRERVPLDWATTQNNLGNALLQLAERENGTARMEEAVAAYRAALEERTRERAPLQWALTQNNLGNALWAMGAREAGTTRLEEAITTYDNALKVLTMAGAAHYGEVVRANREAVLNLLAKEGTDQPSVQKS